MRSDLQTKLRAAHVAREALDREAFTLNGSTFYGVISEGLDTVELTDDGYQTETSMEVQASAAQFGATYPGAALKKDVVIRGVTYRVRSASLDEISLHLTAVKLNK